MDFLLEPPEGTQPRAYLALGPSATHFTLRPSRTVREYIPVAVSHQVCGNLLQQSEERETGTRKYLL